MFCRSIFNLVLPLGLTSCFLFGQQPGDARPKRDAQAIEILDRVVQTVGGAQALASVHDIAESGEITFYWGKDVKGPVTIRALGGNHFRMEADLPESKKTWVVRNGTGSKTEGQRTVPMTDDSAANLENLTYPISHVAAALADFTADVSFVGIEKQEDRSVYRVRVKGQLGLRSNAGQNAPIVKDLLIDALTFDVVSVEDRPFPNRADRSHDTPSRAIEYGDFRVVNGVRIPFSISTRLMGQKTLSIALSEVTFNSNLSDQDFSR
jgi:hypothetical protein